MSHVFVTCGALIRMASLYRYNVTGLLSHVFVTCGALIRVASLYRYDIIGLLSHVLVTCGKIKVSFFVIYSWVLLL